MLTDVEGYMGLQANRRRLLLFMSAMHTNRNSSRSNRGTVTGLALVMGGRSFSVSSSRVKRQIRVATEREVIASQRSGTHELSSDRGIRRWAIGLTSLSFI